LRRRIVTLEQENATLVERVARLQDECRIAILRAERAEERVKRLEEAGDAMARWLEIPTVLGGNADAVQAWRLEKEQS
jgi:hypothetical protein